jgi:putative membrane protein
VTSPPSSGPLAPGGSAADGTAPGDRSAALSWKRVHPVTPLVRGWSVLLVILIVLGQQVGSAGAADVRQVVRLLGIGPAVGALTLVALIGFAYAFIAWRMIRYAVDDESVYLHSGVLFRRQRSARLDRIQGIDTVQPLLARLFGLAELKIEVAGGQDSAVRLAFLRDDEAQQLRNELLAKAAGLGEASHDAASTDATGTGVSGGGGPTPAAPERLLVAVPAGRLIESLARSGAMAWAALSVIVVAVVAVGSRTWSVIFGVLPFAVAAVGYVWSRFSGEFGFRLAQSPDGIRLRHGLVEARAQTLPPGRVQAVRLTQPLLWRSKDWWRVEINVAGYVSAERQNTETVLLPVGTRAEALLAVWLVVPDLGVEDPQATFDVALSGSGPYGGVLGSPSKAAWFDPWGWRRNGYLVTDRALLARRGVLQRSLILVPHERTQSVGLNQGPLQRAFGLASVRLHSTPGPISPVVPHLSAADALELVQAQATRARLARASATPERWMSQEARNRQLSPHPQPSPPPPPSPPSPPLPPPPPQDRDAEQ